MHMTTPASTQVQHGGACINVSPVKLRRFTCFVPLRPCKIKPQCRFASRHSSPLCQAQAASVAEQSAPTSPTKRPRSPGKKGRKKASDVEDDAADTGEPGKRVVIVGGGWAGKSRQLSTGLCSVLTGISSICQQLQAEQAPLSMFCVCVQVLVQQSTCLHKATL